MSALYPVSIEDMVAEVERELYHRRQVNARLVGSSLADRRFEVMSAVLALLLEARDRERQQL